MAEASCSQLAENKKDEVKIRALISLVKEDKREELMNYFDSPERNTDKWHDEIGESAIAAIRNNKPDILKCLIEAGLNLCYKYWNESVSHWEYLLYTAFRSGDKCIVDIIIDSSGISHLHLPLVGGIGLLLVAFESKNTDLVKKAWIIVQEANDDRIKRNNWHPIHELVLGTVQRARYEFDGFDIPISSRELDNLTYFIEEILGFILDQGCDINSTPYTGITPLMVAANAGHMAAVRALVKHGADIFFHDDLTGYDWVIACERWHYDIMEELFQNVSIFEHQEKFESLLHRACERGWQSPVNYLIGRGIDINCTDEKDRTPLIVACEHARGNADIYRCLLDKGADVNRKDEEGRTPLMVACASYWDQIDEVVRCLLDKGADVNCKDGNGRTPLMIACEHRREPVVRCLVAKCIDVGWTDADTRALLLTACRNGWDTVVSFLVDKGADVNHKGVEGDTPLTVACQSGSQSVVRYLFDKGADMNCKNDEGDTPLVVACRYGKESIVKYLCDKGADVNPKGVEGDTPLTVACQSGSQSVVRYLFDKGADMNCKNDEGDTPLMVACLCGKESIVKYLCDKGADINYKDDYGRTPLMRACTRGRGQETVVRYILDKGVDVTCTEYENHTPLTVAMDSLSYAGVFCIVQHMLRHGTRDTDIVMVQALQFLLTEVCGNYRDQFLIGCEELRSNLEDIIKAYAHTGIHLNGRYQSWGRKEGITARDYRGRTLLMIIGNKGLMDFGDLLIQNGADVNGVTGDGYTLLSKVVDKERQSVVELEALNLLEKLLALNVDMRISQHRYHGETPLQCAFRQQQHDLCNLLLDADCSLYKMGDYLHSTQEMQLTEHMQEVRERILGICDGPYSLKAQARLAVLGAIRQGDLRGKLHRIRASKLLPTALVNYLGKAIKFNVDTI